MRNSVRLTPILFSLLVIVLFAAPAFASDAVIYAGPDLWRTGDNGATRADFSDDPIPSDFFCPGSAPFGGVLSFKGRPLTTEPAGLLGNTDTIVNRLDDAAFDKRDRAYTRVQVIAMEFDSIAPVQTHCGLFDAHIVLEGEQPITNMEIVRQRKTGGHFFAEIGVRVRMTFTPRDARVHGTSELVRELLFAPAPNATWANRVGPTGIAPTGFFRVDTDADGAVDTWVPGSSNFAAGWDTDMNQNIWVQGDDCHCDYEECGHRHCTLAAERLK